MKINFKVRFKNIVFIIESLIAVLSPVFVYMGISGQDLTSWAALANTLMSAVSNPYIVWMIVSGLALAITDPTTAGISDSSRALTYTEPGKE